MEFHCTSAHSDHSSPHEPSVDLWPVIPETLVAPIIIVIQLNHAFSGQKNPKTEFVTMQLIRISILSRAFLLFYFALSFTSLSKLFHSFKGGPIWWWQNLGVVFWEKSSEYLQEEVAKACKAEMEISP